MLSGRKTWFSDAGTMYFKRKLLKITLVLFFATVDSNSDAVVVGKCKFQTVSPCILNASCQRQTLVPFSRHHQR